MNADHSPTAAAPPTQLPRHLAVIMDGNGRWAKQRGRPRTLGHRAGARAVNLCIDFCIARGIGALTLFAFSSENWQRPVDEVSALMGLFLRALDREVEELHRRQVRLRFIGDRATFSPDLQRRMRQAESLTVANTGLQLSIAASYGGRWDIVQAARRMAVQVSQGELTPEQIDEARFDAELSLSELPAPDLFIRSGGDQRISNFLLWQLAYTELYFTETLWPDLDAKVLEEALAVFASRERRFGRTSEQLKETST
ncbi:polyprenyl diphosphate synthase [Aquimonas sp.]|uniref:polyprenyl diphosphate synthase n=1 Tax=Aquimonas sp. TaxID=1872588 RepID=UPI0037C1A083